VGVPVSDAFAVKRESCGGRSRTAWFLVLRAEISDQRAEEILHKVSPAPKQTGDLFSKTRVAKHNGYVRVIVNATPTRTAWSRLPETCLESRRRHDVLGLTAEEVAFCDALEGPGSDVRGVRAWEIQDLDQDV
jgi:hypothetical protein